MRTYQQTYPAIQPSKLWGQYYEYRAKCLHINKKYGRSQPPATSGKPLRDII